MLPYLEFVLFYISLFSKDTADSSHCRSSFSVTDHVLTGHVMRTLNHKSFESCTFSCELEPQCFSVNYISLRKTCQLNDATKEYFPGDLVKQKGAFYMGMVTRSYNPCTSMRCENGGTCVSSPSLKCKCLKGFSGPHCEIYDPCVSMDCENGGTCVSSPSLKCKCLKDFSGPRCEIHDPCASMDCENGGTCVVSPSLKCNCVKGYSGNRCQNVQVLGMENNHIPDSSITASSEKPGHEAKEGRLNGNSSWMPTKNQNTEHLSVSFTTKVTIVAIATQGSPIDDCWVERYSYQWFTGTLHDSPKEYQANTDQNTTVPNTFPSPLLSVGLIRIRPKQWSKCIAMRIELYGYEQ